MHVLYNLRTLLCNHALNHAILVPKSNSLYWLWGWNAQLSVASDLYLKAMEIYVLYYFSALKYVCWGPASGWSNGTKDSEEMWANK